MPKPLRAADLQQLLFFFGFLSLMGLTVFLILRKFVWDLADEVYDCGDHLLVRRRGKEEIVTLSNVMNVNAVTYMNPPRITLRLVQPGKFGSEISFSPVGQAMLNPFAKNPVAEDLIVRVDRARREGR